MSDYVISIPPLSDEQSERVNDSQRPTAMTVSKKSFNLDLGALKQPNRLFTNGNVNLVYYLGDNPKRSTSEVDLYIQG